ncbi:MAG: hypothetical protein A2075_22075 [Geobacteraceae bacterium GWC2_58_44]|nr:MAG: hypothetical protein A2075_22075 [Geobacteraceae bacterium GWC2_58_44]
MSSIFRPLIIACTLSLFFSSLGHSVTEIPKVVKPITSIGLTPTIGGYFFAAPQSLNATPLYGLRLSYDHVGTSIVDSLGVEGTVNYFSTKGKSGGEKADGLIFRTDAIYSITPRNKWVPFFAVGVGGLLIDRNGTRDNSPFLNYGLGLKYYYEDYLAFRVDARQLFVYSNVGTSNNYELSTGVSYFFGKERKKKGPPAKAKAPLPKAVPILAEETPETVATDETPLDKLGVIGAAILGITTAPPVFLPAPPVQPQALAYIPPKAPAQRTEVAVLPATPPPAPVAPAPVRVAAEPPRIEQKKVLYLTVEFDFGSSAVRPSYNKQIAALAATIKESRKSKVAIEGHTDHVGKSKPNLVLSQRRANNVKKQLVKNGVDSRKISIKGYGYAKPKATNKTSKGRQKNRRALAVVSVITINDTPVLPEK